ncbi:LexA family protein [Deinococcus roseus]|uniref:Peptidase S24/S26A/S26B/S26C domain-containing protein n=1 Tax=Deinococcus roseus TaxID=392414 RepID=A0ABQ2DIX8_9DEIO|nr:S24 family peptidase [Deinococcus roseus]GGJ56413.1 hypothetical protein GCM10008938_48220 [Deinococcus roseus]
MPIDNRDAEWVLRRKMREADTNASALSLHIGKSRTWAHVQLFKDPLGTLWSMSYKEPEALDLFAQKLGYRNRYDLLIDLDLITKADLKALQDWMELPKRTAAFPLNPLAEPANLTVKIPIYGTVGAGLKKIHANDHPEEYVEFDMRELPKAIDVAKLFILVVNGDSMSDDYVSRQIPHGSKILVESDAVPTDGKIVVAWIPELETGVVKQYFAKGENTLLRSYKVGGPTFWASQYPDMVLEGVVRRVIWEP